jgi:V8-like Glu-specific endopeptidase
VDCHCRRPSVRTSALCSASIVLALLVAAAAPVASREIPEQQRPYSLTSGLHDGEPGTTRVAFTGLVEVPGEPWLRLRFGDWDLGAASFVVMISRLDGGSQRLDATAIEQWRGSSAYFNGDAVEIALHVAPQDTSVHFQVDGVTVAKSTGSAAVPKGICGSDSRTQQIDPAVGRIRPLPCTASIVSNGALIAAGHCTDGTGTFMQVVEFNVPESLADGTRVHSHPDDQYAVLLGDLDYHDDGSGEWGDDWAVFSVAANPNTGLSPAIAQGSFYRMSRDALPATATVVGYGQDDSPLTMNYVLQTDTGTFTGETVEGPSDVWFEHFADTKDGCSGAPVISPATGVAIGVHTGGYDPCVYPTLGNYGTSFENDAFETAIHDFWTWELGPAYVYLDVGHPEVAEDGSVLRPYDTMPEAVAAVPSGGVISVVTGTYPAATNTLTAGEDGKAIDFHVPVGGVVIGD